MAIVQLQRIMGNRSIGLRAVPTAGRLLLLSLLAATLGWGAYALAASAGGINASRTVPIARSPPGITRPPSRGWSGSRRTRPGSAEIEYSLGGCAASLGRVDTALAAWARVPRGSSYAPRAHRPGPARPGSWRAGDRRGVPRPAAEGTRRGRRAGSERMADQLDLYTGRTRAIVRRIERRRASPLDLPGLLRLHWQLDTQPFPLLAVREALDRMAGKAPRR